MATTSTTTTTTHQHSNAKMEVCSTVSAMARLLSSKIEECTTATELNHLLTTKYRLPSVLFLHGSDWDSINFTPYESTACMMAFDKLCLLAWESGCKLSSWQIESELGIIASEWADKKKAPGKAVMRDALPEAQLGGFEVKFVTAEVACEASVESGLESWEG